MSRIPNTGRNPPPPPIFILFFPGVHHRSLGRSEHAQLADRYPRLHAWRGPRHRQQRGVRQNLAHPEMMFSVEGPKILNSTYFLNEHLWFSQFSVVFLWRKSKMKFLLASMKSPWPTGSQAELDSSGNMMLSGSNLDPDPHAKTKSRKKLQI